MAFEQRSSVKQNLTRWNISRKVDYVKVLAQCYLYLRNQGHDATFTSYGEQVPPEEIKTLLEEHPSLEAATDDNLPEHLRHSRMSTALLDYSAAFNDQGMQTMGGSAAATSITKRKFNEERPQKKVKLASNVNQQRGINKQAQAQQLGSDSDISSSSESDNDDNHADKDNKQEPNALRAKQLKKALRSIEQMFSGLTLSEANTREALEGLKTALTADIRALKQQVGPEHTDYGPLIMAIANDQIELVRLLLASGSDVNASGPGGGTPLHMATQRSHFEILGVLLLHEGIKVDAVDSHGQTALHYAVDSSERSDCALLLLRSGADLDILNADKTCYINAQNISGYTALHVAASKPWGEEYVKILVEHGGYMMGSSSSTDPDLIAVVQYESMTAMEQTIRVRMSDGIGNQIRADEDNFMDRSKLKVVVLGEGDVGMSFRDP